MLLSRPARPCLAPACPQTHRVIQRSTGQEYACKTITKTKISCPEEEEDIRVEVGLGGGVFLAEPVSNRRPTVHLNGSRHDALITPTQPLYVTTSCGRHCPPAGQGAAHAVQRAEPSSHRVR